MSTLAIWHGYLLGGTGSNVYTANVARSWRAGGHDVIMFCQDAAPERHDWIDRYESVRGETVVEQRNLATAVRPPGAGLCTMVQADIGDLLPVYLVDRYPGFAQVRRFIDCSDAELELYTAAYAAAMRGVIDRYPLRGALINHAVMGPPALGPVLHAAGITYAVKIHGSELEYAIAEQPDRFVPPAQAALTQATSVIVGSDHIRKRLEQLVGTDCCAHKVMVVPPGVDMVQFAPIPPNERVDRANTLVNEIAERTLAYQVPPQSAPPRNQQIDQAVAEIVTAWHAAGGDPAHRGAPDLVQQFARLRDAYDQRPLEATAAECLQRLDIGAHPTLVFVGKLIHQKGLQLVLAAMPLVRAAVPDARLVVVGFGMLRDALGAMVDAISSADHSLLAEIVARGNALDDGAEEPLAGIGAFFSRRREDAQYWQDAAQLRDCVAFCGQFDHELLAQLWPLCDASVVPSVAAEAFGMVSAEAASCGCPPIVSDHSGLTDVADAISESYRAAGIVLADFGSNRDIRGAAAFDPAADDAIAQLACSVIALLSAPPDVARQVAEAARATVARCWSWDSISARLASLLVC